jgi:hypothetical protein
MADWVDCTVPHRGECASSFGVLTTMRTDHKGFFFESVSWGLLLRVVAQEAPTDPVNV